MSIGARFIRLRTGARDQWIYHMSINLFIQRKMLNKNFSKFGSGRQNHTERVTRHTQSAFHPTRSRPLKQLVIAMSCIPDACAPSI